MIWPIVAYWLEADPRNLTERVKPSGQETRHAYDLQNEAERGARSRQLPCMQDRRGSGSCRLS